MEILLLLTLVLNSGDLFDNTWFALGESRGIETPGSKTFMRISVIAMDLALYVPAVVWFTRLWWHTRSRRTQVSGDRANWNLSDGTVFL